MQIACNDVLVTINDIPVLNVVFANLQARSELLGGLSAAYTAQASEGGHGGVF